MSASPAAPPRSATGQPPPSARPEGETGESEDLVQLGPVVGMGLPNLFSYGGLIKVTPYFGAGINVGLIPEIRVPIYGEATVSFHEYDIYAHIFPFGGGFFFGAGVGYATIDGTLEVTVDTSKYSSLVPSNLSIPDQITYQSQGSVRTMVVTPQIGYLYVTDIGFCAGVDFGAQLPIAPSNTTYNSRLSLPEGTPQALIDELQSEFVEPADKEVEATLETLGRVPLPSLNVRIGWLF